jgi:site-specific recombinase XerC
VSERASERASIFKNWWSFSVQKNSLKIQPISQVWMPENKSVLQKQVQSNWFPSKTQNRNFLT